MIVDIGLEPLADRGTFAESARAGGMKPLHVTLPHRAGVAAAAVILER